MNAKRVNAAADVISRAMKQGKTLPATWAAALESAQLLQSPETAAEAQQWRAALGEEMGRRRRAEEEIERLLAERHSTNEALSDAAEALRVQRDRIAELEAELTPFRALELGTPEGRISAKCENAKHPVWLRDLDDARGCPWCRVAELEELTPAPIQTCRTCGAGYDLGQPCSTCRFHALMDQAQKQRQLEDPHESPLHRPYAVCRDLPATGPWGDPLAYGPTGVRCGCGKDAHSNLVPCQPDSPEDPHDSPLHHDYAVSRDFPTTTIETTGSAL